MKKLLKWALPCLFLTTMITACGDGDDKPNGGNLTPDENKAKLETIGKELVGKIDPKVHKSLVDVVEYFDEIVGTMEFKDPANLQSALKTIANICTKSDVNGMMAFASTRSDLYKASQFLGIYTYKPNTRKWEYTASLTSLEFHFDYQSKKTVISLTPSGKETNIDIEEENIQIAIPENVTLSVKLASDELCKLSVNSQLNTTSKAAVIDASLAAGGYTFIGNVNMSGSKASYQSSLKKGSELLISGMIDVNGTNLTNPSEGDLDNPQNMFGKASSQINILNQVNFIVECSNIKEFVRELDNVDHSGDHNDNNVHNDEKSTKQEAEISNRYTKGEMRYGDSDDVIANFAFKATLEEKYNSSEYWYVAPVIIFKYDDSSYLFDSYFDEVSFSSFIDSLERLADEFESIYN